MEEEKVVRLVHSRGAEADVHLHGAHITRFVESKNGRNIFFVSEKALFGEGQAIRGGVPVIFPQFR
jgi:glucose-6-phosphate 1-epimerase